MGDLKYTRFQEIPKLISYGSWECSFRLESALRTVADWQREYALDIDPDFQRLHVWNESQQIAWMEYILRGGRTGRTFFFNCAEWNHRAEMQGMVLVDGKQRLESLRRFYADEIPVFGSLFSEFKDEPDMLRGGQVLFNVNDLQSRAEILQWYIEFNAGGTPHTNAEIQRVRKLLGAEKGVSA